MHSELTNLLPPEHQRAFRRNYFIRLSVVVVALGVALAVAAAILLLPTYVFLSESVNTENAHLAAIESTTSSSDEVSLSAQLTMLSSNAATLSALASTHSVSSIIRNVLAVSRPGIILSGFSYTPGAGKNSGMLAISGTAATRDVLRSYQLTLQGSSFARSADLPVSTYAKDTDIAFTITMTLSL